MKDSIDQVIDDDDWLELRKQIKDLIDKLGYDIGIRVQVQAWGQYEGPNYPPIITIIDELEEPTCAFCHEKTYYNERIKGEWVYICPSCLGKRGK